MVSGESIFIFFNSKRLFLTKISQLLTEKDQASNFSNFK